MRLKDLRVVFIGIRQPFSAGPLRAITRRCKLVGVVESRATRVPWSVEESLSYRSVLRSYARWHRAPYFMLASKGPRLVEFLKEVQPDIICVAGMAQLLRRAEYEIPRMGAINLHPTFLPLYRGPRPFFWQCYDMDLRGGVTVHRIDEGIDTGDILTQTLFPLPLGAEPQLIIERTVRAGSAAVVRALAKLVSGDARPMPQRHLACPRYARMGTADEKLMDAERWPIERLWHFLRGTNDEDPSLPLPPGHVGWWNIGRIERRPSGEPPGSIARDEAGYYVAHREGRIRLRLGSSQEPTTRVLNAVLRRIWKLHRWWL